jgi:hypothetical protein
MKGMRGQSTLEYALLIAVVLSGLLAVEIYAKRAVEGRLKSGADQIGEQWSTAKSKFKINVTNVGTREDTLQLTGASKSEITKAEIQTRDTSDYAVQEDVEPRDLFE